MRGHIQKRGKAWRIKVTQGRDPATGKVRQKWFTYPTRQEAEAHLADMLAKIHGGGSIPTTRITVGQFLREWLEKRAGAIRATSHESYVQIVNGHLLPTLGTIPLRHLTALDAQGYITTKLQGRKDGDGKMLTKALSPGSVRKHIAVLREALGHAVKWGLLARNVCDLVEKPRVARKEMRVWDEEQTQMFLAEAKRQSSPYYPLYLTAITTGLRAGELLGLRWSSIDFLLGTARVERTFYRMGEATVPGAEDREGSARSGSAAHRRRDPAPSEGEAGRHQARDGQRVHRPGSGVLPARRQAAAPAQYRDSRLPPGHQEGQVAAYPVPRPTPQPRHRSAGARRASESGQRTSWTLRPGVHLAGLQSRAAGDAGTGGNAVGGAAIWAENIWVGTHAVQRRNHEGGISPALVFL